LFVSTGNPFMARRFTSRCPPFLAAKVRLSLAEKKIEVERVEER